jgi:hypothetical protein
MASTRNNNTRGNYCIQQRQFSESVDYTTYINSQAGEAVLPAFPAAGSAPPSHMSRDALAGNPIAIESMLFGIGSTNLVTPQPQVTPQVKALPTIHYFERNKVIMPKPLVIRTDERPFPVPK